MEDKIIILLCKTCCECGEDYPDAIDIMEGNVFSSICRYCLHEVHGIDIDEDEAEEDEECYEN